MTDIGAALIGIKYLREFTKWVGDMRKDADSLGRVNEAMRFVGDVQDQLTALREENLRLVEEKRQLAEQLRVVEDWQTRRSKYELFKTPGGAVVLRAMEPLIHYACPSCADSRREIHILQDGKNMAGSFRCTGCKETYYVNEAKSFNPNPKFR